MARSQLLHVHIECERRNRPKILHQKNMKKPFLSPRKGAGRKFSRRRRRSLNARSATWGAPNGGERCISSTSVFERIPRASIGTQESFLEPPGQYAQNEMKRGAITTLPGLREAFIVSKKRIIRVTSRLLSTRSIRLKRLAYSRVESSLGRIAPRVVFRVLSLLKASQSRRFMHFIELI